MLYPLIALVLSAFVCSDALALEEHASIFSIEGVVEVRAGAAAAWSPAVVDQKLGSGAVVRTGNKGRAGIVYRDGRLIRLAPGTLLELAVGPNQAEQIKLEKGTGFFLSRGSGQFPTIVTPTVSTAIRGTEITIAASDHSTYVAVLDGDVQCQNVFGAIDVAAGEWCISARGRAPWREVLVSPRNSVQWTIPALELDLPPEVARLRNADVRERIRYALDQLKRGDVAEADGTLALLRNVKELREGKFLADALLAVVQLANGDVAGAEASIQAALGARSESYLVLFASALVAQSKFDLVLAEETLKRAIALHGQDPVLLSRLAELELGRGDSRQAEQTVQQALHASPNSAYALAVRGFISLMKSDIDAALADFQSSSESNPSFGLPHLGRGLGLIAQGDLQQGRAEILKAVLLEPQRALYRSYLGKALFEEGSYGRSAEEYHRAIEIDPNDPTPYLYRSYQHVAQNNLVAALYDVDRSIELNDKRAVYRSRMLLDSDLASRTANLGRVFSQLGFGQRARVEALQSLSLDYSDYSAHRLLADSYRTLDTAETRLTELRVADLLSPLSFNVFQDARSEASINEYSALFDRAQYRSGVNVGVVTNEDTQSARVYNTGRGNNTGYYLGVDELLTDGSKRGTYGRDYRVRGSFQHQASLETRAILDLRGTYRTIREQTRQDAFDDFDVDLGINHRLAPGENVIGQISYGHDARAVSADDKRLLAVIESVRGEAAETARVNALLDSFGRNSVSSIRSSVQYIGSLEFGTAILGAEYYGSSAHRRENSRLTDDEGALFTGLDYLVRSEQANNVESRSGYGYVSIPLLERTTLSLGAAYSFVEYEPRIVPPYVDTTESADRVTPKVGITYSPTGDLLLRAGYFETFRKSNLEDYDSIEPTVVGGLNQRFGDLPATFARNVGLGADYRFSRDTYAGLEMMHRELEEPLALTTSALFVDYDSGRVTQFPVVTRDGDLAQRQDILSAYLYHVFNEQVVGTLDYRISTVDYDDSAFEQLTQTDRAAVAIRYFHRSGFFAYGKATWRLQRLEQSFSLPDGNEEFWVADLGLGYRLPDRHGTIQLELLNLFDNEFQYDQILGVDELVENNFGVRFSLATNF